VKTVLISLLVLISTAAQAAPIFANLEVLGISREMTTVNPKFYLVSSANLTINTKSIELTLNKRMPQCAAGMMCIQVMPAPIKISLTVTKVEQTPCSLKYTASTSLDALTQNQEEVVVEDFTKSTCKTLIAQPIGTVTYKVTGISSLTKMQETAQANFVVNGEFVKAQN
jgi:hypothetical protein